MKSKKLNTLAFPCECDYSGNELNGVQTGNRTGFETGMSKRFYAACAAMQGMLANVNQSFGVPNVNPESMESALESQTKLNADIVTRAYEFADELLTKEQEEK